MSVVKEVLPLSYTNKLPIYTPSQNSQFLSLGFESDEVRVCRINFHRHRDRFMVIVWSRAITFDQVVNRIIKETTLNDFKSEEEIVLDGVNLHPLNTLETVSTLQENNKYIEVSTKENRKIDGIDLLQAFTVY